MNTKQKQPPRQQPRKRFITFSIIAVSLMIAAILGFIGYNKYLDHQDKQRFETVRASVETLHGRLQAAADSGTTWEVGTSCRQGSVKFQEAKKGCGIGTSADILVTTDTEAMQLIGKYRTLFREAIDLFKYEGEGLPPKPPSFPAGLNNGYDGASFRERETNMVCSSFFEIDTRFQQDKTKRILKINFGCGDRARQLHYPRTDD